ncbi:kinase-like domain-containing protein [Hyaloraphidium curvatum]|nr:kinase-like domain-containing protein [Hyaloraphidium curvatum]
MQESTPSIAMYRASSCTLCSEKEKQMAAERNASKPGRPMPADEVFDGPIVRGAAEDWATGRVLGEGAFAEVRVAKGRTGRIAVVKQTKMSANDHRNLFFSLREALALTHLAHDSIPPLLDYVRTSTASNLVMAVAPGEELFSYTNGKQDGHLEEDETRRIVAGILVALAHAHSMGVLHRDIKLDNVFYDATSGHVSVIDWGLATFFDRNTLLDEAVGCTNYASPSLLRFINRRTPYLAHSGHQDLWALGVLAFGCLTGYFPFRSEDTFELELEIQGRPSLEVEGLSELGHDFLRTILNPANEGRITAESLLRHGWVADFATPASARSRLPIVKLPSVTANPKRACTAAEAELGRRLPFYLRELAADIEEDDDDSSSESGRTVAVPRVGSEASFASVTTLGSTRDSAEVSRSRMSANLATPARSASLRRSKFGKFFEKLFRA